MMFFRVVVPHCFPWSYEGGRESGKEKGKEKNKKKRWGRELLSRATNHVPPTLLYTGHINIANLFIILFWEHNTNNNNNNNNNMGKLLFWKAFLHSSSSSSPSMLSLLLYMVAHNHQIQVVQWWIPSWWVRVAPRQFCDESSTELISQGGIHQEHAPCWRLEGHRTAVEKVKGGEWKVNRFKTLSSCFQGIFRDSVKYSNGHPQKNKPEIYVLVSEIEVLLRGSNICIIIGP